MFGDVCFAGQTGQPISFPGLVEDSQLNRMAGHFFEDEVMDAVMEACRPDRDLVFGPRAWVKPRPRWCPYTCVVTRPRRPTRQHFVILPRLAYDATARGDHPCGKGIPDSSETKVKEKNSSPSRKRTASTHSVSSEGFCSRKQAASPSSVSSEGSTNGARDCVGNSCSSTDIGKARGESSWQFSVDMKGCDEVRATTEKGMLMVEGRGSSDTSQQMVRYTTSLPRHVSHDSLTARLTNGRLTVTQKAGAQLEGQARTLPIDVQQQESPEPEEEEQQQQQQQQQNTEVVEQKEKSISSTDAQEKQSCKAPHTHTVLTDSPTELTN